MKEKCVLNYPTPVSYTELCIRIRLGPKLLAGSGTEQLRIRNEI